MRNYRNIGSNKNYLSGLGSGKSQGFIPPDFYNDSGNYTYFYMDFRGKNLKTFSLGMLLESIQVLPGTGITPIPVTRFQRIASGKYKLYCNYAGQLSLVVINREDGWLTFVTGNKKVPAFSETFEILGPSPVVKVAYAYDLVEEMPATNMGTIDNYYLDFVQNVAYPISESETIETDYTQMTVNENTTISFWSV